MNKFVKVVGSLAVLFSLAACAQSAAAQDINFSQTTLSGDVSLQSRDDYRGQEYSTDPSLDLGLKVNNLGFQGLYVDGAFSKVGNTFPLGGDTSRTQLESDFGVGYNFNVAQDWNLDLSVHHINNAQEFLVYRNGKLVAGDYNEARAKLSYNIFFAEVGQAFGPDQNTYTAVGVDVPVTDQLHVGGAVSAFHYKNDDVTQYGSGNRYNNTEVFASYDLLKNLNVYGKYSFGGRAYAGRELSDYGVVGVKYSF